ncbi:MAG: PQQ-dependent sugar dehydrogenase, partial [Planctomycetota bacterium]
MRKLIFIGLLLCACNSGSDSVEDPFGLDQRRTVTGVTFPTGLPQPTPLNTVVAFPNVSFPDPVFLTVAPGDQDNLYVVEQDGRIQVFENDPTTSIKRLFLDIAVKVNSSGSEEGLLGLAFDPDYETNGFFYVNYTASSPRRTVIARYTATGAPLAGDAATEQILLEFDQPEDNHNGGMLAFGRDGMLYIATGDGGSGNDPDDNAQNLGNLLGKILRIDPSGSIPLDNPFVGVLGAREEIWAYGLRNPWRFSFDRDTGTLWAGDVGQNAVEEIDIIVKGANYGWRVYEGDRSNINPGNLPATDFTAPVYTYPHPTGFAVVGGYVYRGNDLPSLFGAYVYADNGTGRIWALVHDGNQVISNLQVGSLQSPSSFGQDHDGEIYICNLGDDRIYRLEERVVRPPAIPQTLSETGLYTNTANLEPASGLIEYDVSAPLWTDGAEKRYWLALPGSARIGFHPTEAWDFPVGTVVVKHFELGGQKVETRVLVHATSGWQGFSYKWNPAQDDADLLPGSLTENINGQ